MKKKLFLLILTVAMLIASTLSSAEIIPVWNKVNEAGIIHDMEFLRGENQFILLAGLGEEGTIQIRDTQTGELVSSFPIPTLGQFNQIEITPDSNRFVMTTGGDKVNSPSIEIRSIEDFSRINRLQIQMDKDSVDTHNNPYYFVFKDVVIDPVKTYLYAFLTKTNYFNDDDIDRTWLRVYNYETMEEIINLTPVGYEYELMKCMDISEDGRQLAVLNEGKAYLKVWNTETFDLTKDKQLYDDNLLKNEDYWCESDDIEFSSIDDNLIYFSGGYPMMNNEFNPFGIYNYVLNENSVNKINQDENNYSGDFILFNQDKRMLLSSGGNDEIINMELNNIEIPFQDFYSDFPSSKKVIFSSLNNIFVGTSVFKSGSVKYDSQTNIENNYEEEIIITPNPTASFVNINLECSEADINYQINNSEGVLVFQNTVTNQSENLQIDLSHYPSGVYFLTIDCKNPVTYKIVKEG